MLECSQPNLPIVVSSEIGDAATYVRDNPDLFLANDGTIINRISILAPDIELSAEIPALNRWYPVDTKKATTLLGDSYRSTPACSTSEVPIPAEVKDRMQAACHPKMNEPIIVRSYWSAAALNEFSGIILGNRPGEDVLEFANAPVSAQDRYGAIDGNSYRQALAANQFLRASVPFSTGKFGLFTHDRGGIHDRFAMAMDPDMMKPFKMMIRTMTQVRFLEWFENSSYYIGGLMKKIIEGNELDRKKWIFSDFSYDEAALMGLCRLYGTRDNLRNKNKALQRYSEYLENVRQKIAISSEPEVAEVI